MDEGKRLARRLNREYHKLCKPSWRTLEKTYDVPAGTLNRIAKSDGEYLPQNPEYRQRLGLSVATCPKCLRKITRPREVRTYKSLFDLSTSDLQYLMEHRLPF